MHAPSKLNHQSGQLAACTHVDAANVAIKVGAILETMPDMVQDSNNTCSVYILHGQTKFMPVPFTPVCKHPHDLPTL